MILDKSQMTKEVNIFPNKSLENDLQETLVQAASPIVSREDAIKNSFSKGADENADA